MPEIVLLNLDSVVPNKRQSRAIFDPEKLQELANSIKEQGVLQPILVRRKGENNYEIIAGERRYRACKMVGLDRIPAIIKNADEMGSMIDSFLENAQRERLTPEAAAVRAPRTNNPAAKTSGCAAPPRR